MLSYVWFCKMWMINTIKKNTLPFLANCKTRSLFWHLKNMADRGYGLMISLVRGTPTAGVLIHWVIISRRWEHYERIQQRDSESPINTDSPRKEKCCDAFPGCQITGPQNTQNWHHFTRTSSSTHSNYLCLLTLLHLVLLSSFSM